MTKHLDLAELHLEAGSHSPDSTFCIMGLLITDAALERFRSKCAPQDGSGCILWIGSFMWKGYGRFHVAGTTVRAHRFSYALSRNLTPGLVLDHLCGNRACVNPLHLEEVTLRENVLRSERAPAGLNIRKTHCPKGHEYAGQNLFIRRTGRGKGGRECRACGREEARRYQAKRRAAL